MRTLQQLKDLCVELQLVVRENPAKQPYLDALRQHFLRRDFPNGLPYVELSPMLCFPFDSLKRDEQDYVWKDGNDWAAQQKLNGCRIVLHYVKDVGVFAHSRRVSEESFRRAEYSDHLIFRETKPSFTATVDGEALIEQAVDTQPYTAGGGVTRSSLQSTSAVLALQADAARRLQQEQAALKFHCFDVVQWNGEDLRQKPLKERLEYLGRFRGVIEAGDNGSHFIFPATVTRAKRGFFEKILKEGGEGVVLKNLNSPYNDSSGRDRYGWIKVKRSLQFTAFLSNFVRGRRGGDYENRVGSLDFSILTEDGFRLIARISNIDWETRKKISYYNKATDEVRLDPTMLGRVAVVQGQEFSPRAFRLVHPRLIRWRSDLRQEDCCYAAKDLLSLRTGGMLQPLRKATA